MLIQKVYKGLTDGSSVVIKKLALLYEIDASPDKIGRGHHQNAPSLPSKRKAKEPEDVGIVYWHVSHTGYNFIHEVRLIKWLKKVQC